jgi:hypothetical protein
VWRGLSIAVVDRKHFHRLDQLSLVLHACFSRVLFPFFILVSKLNTVIRYITQCSLALFFRSHRPHFPSLPRLSTLDLGIYH